MAPKLYMTELSCPVRAVLMCAKAIDLELELIEINLFEQEHLTPEYLELNPLHTVPTMDDDGFVLYESHAIMGYLVEKYSEDKSLYPDEVYQRALIHQRLHFDSGYFFPRLFRMAVPILFQGVDEVSEEHITAINEAYGFIETFLQDSDYIAGNDLSIADFSISSTITNASSFVPLDEDTYPNILAWRERLDALPYYDIDRAGGELARAVADSKLSK